MTRDDWRHGPGPIRRWEQWEVLRRIGSLDDSFETPPKQVMLSEMKGMSGKYQIAPKATIPWKSHATKAPAPASPPTFEWNFRSFDARKAFAFTVHSLKESWANVERINHLGQVLRRLHGPPSVQSG